MRTDGIALSDSDVDSLFNGLDSDNSGAVEIKELFDTVAITM